MVDCQASIGIIHALSDFVLGLVTGGCMQFSAANILCNLCNDRHLRVFLLLIIIKHKCRPCERHKDCLNLSTQVKQEQFELVFFKLLALTVVEGLDLLTIN